MTSNAPIKTLCFQARNRSTYQFGWVGFGGIGKREFGIAEKDLNCFCLFSAANPNTLEHGSLPFIGSLFWGKKLIPEGMDSIPAECTVQWIISPRWLRMASSQDINILAAQHSIICLGICVCCPFGNSGHSSWIRSLFFSGSSASKHLFGGENSISFFDWPNQCLPCHFLVLSAATLCVPFCPLPFSHLKELW